MKNVACKIVLLCLFATSAVWAVELPAKRGPRPRVAVAKFGATDRFAQVYGGWDIGGGLAAQLVTALIESGKVVVVERATLSKVLIEQELGQSGLSSSLTQTPTGQLLGVDYLVVGEVTEFEDRQMGGGGSMAIMKGFGPKFGGEAVAAHVAMDLRVVDTRTGEVLLSHRSQGKAWEKAFGAKIDYKIIDFGGDLFHKTPLGKATRRAIEDAVSFTIESIENRNKDFNWLARVIEADGSHLYFDAGQNAGIRKGDRFRVSNVQKVLTDPETNEVIGLVENNLGLAEALEVAPKYAKARMLGGLRPPIGALVRFANQASVSENNEDGMSGSSATFHAGYDIME